MADRTAGSEKSCESAPVAVTRHGGVESAPFGGCPAAPCRTDVLFLSGQDLWYLPLRQCRLATLRWWQSPPVSAWARAGDPLMEDRR